jgi:hypothetical protein
VCRTAERDHRHYEQQRCHPDPHNSVNSAANHASRVNVSAFFVRFWLRFMFDRLAASTVRSTP